MEVQQPYHFNTLFSPLNNQNLSDLSLETIQSQGFFSQAQFSPENIGLTLINSHVLLYTINQPQIPYSALSLSFDLKLQIIYQAGLTVKNIFGKKIGFRLFLDGNRTMNFFSGSLARVEQFVTVLGKKINQKGFHQLFKPLKKLGKGNFASVYQVERVTDKKRFAVKAFSKQNSFSAKNGRESLINELNIMRQLSLDPHPNVLHLQAVYESENSIYVVLELLSGGQLFHHIQQQQGHFSTEQIKQFLKGLLQGLAHLHQQRIMHRDLKPENIMLRTSGSMSPVIVDYGLATPADIQKYLFFRCGTPGYVAPEIIQLNESKHIEPQCDIFSAGVIFHILLTRKALFAGTKYDQVYKKNKEMDFNLDSESYSKVDKSALALLRLMLLADPKQRIIAENALKHDYFGGSQKIEEEEEVKVYSPVLTNVDSTLEKKKSKKTFFLF